MLTQLEQWLESQAAAKEDRSGAECPIVTLAYAQSLDGSIAARRGQPLVLSGGESQRLTHRLRGMQDAILVGIGTVLADNPRLTVRLADGPSPQPVILDSHLRTPLQTNLISNPRPAWIAGLKGEPEARRAALQETGARVFTFEPGLDGRVPLTALLEKLGSLGIRRLMVEGGGQVITSFLEQRLADWLVLTIAPVFIGGLPAVDRRVTRRLVQAHSQWLGEDLVVWGKLL